LFAEPQDVQMALFEPDCYAWRLFVALNWPAEPNSCKPDQARTLGAPGEVVWERWILKQDVYLKDAVAPMTWDANCQDPTVAKTLEPTAQFSARALLTGTAALGAAPTLDMADSLLFGGGAG
jgi:hypothetical protein